MNCSRTSGRGPEWTASRRIVRGLAASVCAGILVASGSVVLSFAASPQDDGKPAATSGGTKRGSTSKQAAAGKARAKGQAKGKADRKQPGAEAGEGPTGPLPARPARVVTPPSMSSADLDGLIHQFLTSTAPKVEPATITTDIEFVRRIYFDVIGHPPTPAQVELFVHDHGKDKRARLIDTLLGSPEYARNWANYWRDVISFHATNENLNRVRFEELEGWLAKRLQANTPWDTIVAALITATGRNDENGAVAFTLAHEARPVEMAGEVSRIFMGVQIQCAQCHDHKTDSWKRREFHELAAFFAGVGQNQVVKGGPGELPVVEVVPKGTRRYTMPELDNPAKQIPIAPRFFLASSKSSPAPALPEALAVKERRAIAASYITGQDNPWFAKAYINRIWYVLMGEAFFEPIDDIGPERTPKAPEVLEPLAAQWQKGGYDIRWLFQTILNTDAYQRRVRSTFNAAGKTPFASSCPSRYRADQLFDALVDALAIPLDASGNLIAAGNNGARRGPGGQAAASPKAQARLAQAQGNGKNGANAGLPNPGRLAAQPLTKGGAKKAAEAAGLASQVGKKPAAAMRQGGLRLPFDRLFGVDPSVPNEDVMGTIPQALFLMNGGLVNGRTQARPGTALGEIMAAAPNPRAALGALYMRVLSRQPTNQEVDVCSKYLAAVGNPAEAFEDIYWSLINSTEFLTRR
jgi:Protein of unknown function (DUF1549)/Protein of unknown function (DUF1553)